jgi:hypothetical protein
MIKRNKHVEKKRRKKKKKGRQNKTSDKIDFLFFIFYNVNVFEILFNSIHLETDLEEEHEQKHHN